DQAFPSTNGALGTHPIGARDRMRRDTILDGQSSESVAPPHLMSPGRLLLLFLPTRDTQLVPRVDRLALFDAVHLHDVGNAGSILTGNTAQSLPRLDKVVLPHRLLPRVLPTLGIDLDGAAFVRRQDFGCRPPDIRGR